MTSNAGIPRLYAAASLKRREGERPPRPLHRGIPRLYAAASLKHDRGERGGAVREAVFRGFMPRPH